MDKSEKKNKSSKKRRPIRRGLKRALVTLLTLAVLAAGGFLGYYLFQVTEIEVVGNDTFSDGQILSYVDVKLGQNIFTVDPSEVKKSLAGFPYIEVVSVDRVYPSKIRIKLKERSLKLAVQYGDRYILIDVNGVAVEMASGLSGLVELRGVAVQSAVIGSRIQGLDDYDVYQIGAVFSAFEDSSIEKDITYLDLSIPTAITVGMRNGLKIRIGDAENMEQKRAWIDTLYPRLLKEGKRFGTLDASGKHGASYIPD